MGQREGGGALPEALERHRARRVPAERGWEDAAPGAAGDGRERGGTIVSDGFVETNGIRMHYLDHGGEGPTLVLLPGLTANSHSFGGLVRAGLTDVAHVLALDMR